MRGSDSPSPRPHHARAAAEVKALTTTAAAPTTAAAAAAALAAESSSAIEVASLRRIGDFLRLVEERRQQQQQQLQPHQHPPGAIVTSVGSACSIQCSSSKIVHQLQQKPPQQPLLPALRALLADLKVLCDRAESSRSRSSSNDPYGASSAIRSSEEETAATAAAAAKPCVRSAIEGILGSAGPIGASEQLGLLRSLLRSEGLPRAYGQMAHDGFAAAAAPALSSAAASPVAAAAANSTGKYFETCGSPSPSTPTPSTAAPPPSAAAAAAGSAPCAVGAPAAPAADSAAGAATGATLRVLREEAAAAAAAAVSTPHLLSFEGGCLRAADAVRLCGQAQGPSSARFIPKFRGNPRCCTPSGAAAAAAAAEAAAAAGNRQYQAWLEGAYLPEYDANDEYTEDTDPGYTPVDMTQAEFLAAFCGAPLGGPSWGAPHSEGMHPLFALGVEPAVDVVGARLEMAAAAAAAAASAAAAEQSQLPQQQQQPQQEVRQEQPTLSPSSVTRAASLSPAATAAANKHSLFRLGDEASCGSSSSGRGSRATSRPSSPAFGGPPTFGALSADSAAEKSDIVKQHEQPRTKPTEQLQLQEEQQQQQQQASADYGRIFGLGDVVDAQRSSCSSQPATKAAAATAPEAAKSPEECPAVSSEDELAGCGMQEQSAAAAEAGKLADVQQQQEQLERQQQEAYIAARTWEETYCDGDKQRFQQRQQARAAAALSLACYPPSPDPAYPRQCRVRCLRRGLGAPPGGSAADESVVYDCFSLKVIFKRNSTGADPHKEMVLPSGALLAGRYRVQHEVGAAAFSRCLQGIDECTGQRVCLKVMKNEKEFLDQSLDEASVLRLLLANGDPDEYRFLRLLDYMYVSGHVVLVTELLDEDLYTFSTVLKRHREPSFWSLGRIQIAARDVLLALKFIHQLHIIHGDLKPENILAVFTGPLAKAQKRKQQLQRQPQPQATMTNAHSNSGSGSGGSSGFESDLLDLFRVKVIDFGNCCFTSDELVVYTQSRSYRAPEVLLELPYCQQIDIWSLGCIVYELWTGDMLLGCYTVPSLLAKMVGLLGPLPSYMARSSPVKHQLLDPEGFLYSFIDHISNAQEFKQQSNNMQQQPSVSLDMRPPEDTLLNLVQDHLRSRQGGSPRHPSSTSGSGSSNNSRVIRFFIPKRTSLRQRLRCSDDLFVDFVSKMLQIDPCKRWTAAQLLEHPFLTPGRYIDGIKAP